VACLDLEAEADIENGWERFDPEQVTPQVDNAIVRRRSRNMKVDNEEAVSSSPIADLSK
jgi:hypothetical protein